MSPPYYQEKKNRDTKIINAVDLFCGAGGLTHGLEKAGVIVQLGFDSDHHCAFPYNFNNSSTFIHSPVERLNSSDFSSSFHRNHVSLLAGCAPCQTFSTYNQKAKKTDYRWKLLTEFSRLINEANPDLVTMENVPKLLNHRVFHEFRKNLINGGYRVNFELVDCSRYGVPQIRKRLVLMASKFSTPYLLPPSAFPWKKTTVEQTIDMLPELRAGETSSSDPLHQSSSLSTINLARIRASSPGGTWRDWPIELRAKCHLKNSGKTYSGVYGRMKPNDFAPTITTQFFGYGNGRFGHYKQDRGLSLREGALIQSFPPDYSFVEPGKPIYMKVIGRLIGNAVPVRLGEVIGASFYHHLEKEGI